MDKYRLRFEKTGLSVYISHLDLMRMMQRAFFRADLPLKYSEGFNPHAQISIALPMSVGTASVCELMDFRMEGEPDPRNIPEMLNPKLPAGIEVTSAYRGGLKIAALEWMSVAGELHYDSGVDDTAADALNGFFSAESIVYLKKTKRGENRRDIAPSLHKAVFKAGGGIISMSATVSAKELSPGNMMEALRQNAPELAPNFAQFTRIETYQADFSVFR